MKNLYAKNFIRVSLIGLLVFTACLANAQDKITVSGAGTSAVNGTYTYAGISNSQPYYTNGVYRLEYRYDNFDYFQWGWEIWDPSFPYPYYFQYISSSTPLGGSWDWDWGSYPIPTFSNQVAFTNGSAYTAQTPANGTNNNPIGRFMLDPGIDGSNVTAATVQLGGTATGITAVKLWSSTDNTFNSASDVQLSSKTYASSVTFNGISSAISNSGTYYFITADVSSGATGSITASIANAAAFTISSGSVTTSISNASLSSGSVPLPIQLLSFSAQSKPDATTLLWTTAKEEGFAGFEPERSVDGSTWTKLSFVAGKAADNMATTKYSYTDNNSVTGHIFYRLKMIDADGNYTYSKQLTVVKNNHAAALQNYPNPFTGTTSVVFQLPVSSVATLKVYNNIGAEVSTLINKQQLDAGSYTVFFDGTSLPAGLYHYTLRYGNERLSGTMLLKK